MSNKEEFEGLPDNYKDAKKEGFTFYFTGNPCKHGHISKRYTNGRNCVACSQEINRRPETKEKNRKWRQENRERKREMGRLDYKKNKQAYLKRAKDNYLGNREAKLEYAKAYYNENKSHIRKYRSSWGENNRHLLRKYGADRRALLKSRTLNLEGFYKELNELSILEIYQSAEDWGKITGEEYHVDHIIPLKGENVSGLHVWYNLQVITKEQNLQKKNKLLDEHIYCVYDEET